MRTGEQWFHKGVFGREMDARQPVCSKCLVESSVMCVWSTYSMLTTVVDILYASNSLSANENPMKDCYFFQSQDEATETKWNEVAFLKNESTWIQCRQSGSGSTASTFHHVFFFFTRPRLWSQIVLLCKITSLILFSINCIFSQDAFWRRLYYNLLWIILLSWKLLVIFRVPSYF